MSRREDEAERGVVLARVRRRRSASASRGSARAASCGCCAQRIDDAPTADRRPARPSSSRISCVDVLELPERRPAGVAPAPARVGRQPHGERLGEVLVRVALGVVLLQVEHEALAVRLRRVVLRVRLRRLAEELLAPAAPPQAIRVLDGVAGLVAQDAHAPGRRAAFDLAHLAALELRQARVREVEGDGDAGHAVGRVPLVRQPEVRAGTPGRAARARDGAAGCAASPATAPASRAGRRAGRRAACGPGGGSMRG